MAFPEAIRQFKVSVFQMFVYQGFAFFNMEQTFSRSHAVNRSREAGTQMEYFTFALKKPRQPGCCKCMRGIPTPRAASSPPGAPVATPWQAVPAGGWTEGCEEFLTAHRMSAVLPRQTSAPQPPPGFPEWRPRKGPSWSRGWGGGLGSRISLFRRNSASGADSTPGDS